MHQRLYCFSIPIFSIVTTPNRPACGIVSGRCRSPWPLWSHEQRSAVDRSDDAKHIEARLGSYTPRHQRLPCLPATDGSVLVESNGPAPTHRRWCSVSRLLKRSTDCIFRPLFKLTKVDAHAPHCPLANAQIIVGARLFMLLARFITNT